MRGSEAILAQHQEWAQQWAQHPMRGLLAIVERFLRDTLTAPKITSRETGDWYRKRMDQFAEWLLEQEITDPFTLDVFRRYVVALEERGLKPNTRRGHINILHRLGRWLHEHGYAEEDPAVSLRPPPMPEVLVGEISPGDAERIIAEAEKEGIRSLSIVLFLRDTGVRCKEILGLLWRDVDTANRLARVEGKKGKARTVFFSERTAAALDQLYEEIGHAAVDQAFWSHCGPLRMQTFRRLLRRLAKNAGVKGPIHPHAWRHAYGSGMTNGSCPTLALQTLMGHCSPEVTRRYTRLTALQLRALYDRHAPWSASSADAAGANSHP